MKTFQEFVNEALKPWEQQTSVRPVKREPMTDVRNRDVSARAGYDPRTDRVGRSDLGRGPDRFNIPDRSPTLGMDKMERTRETMLRQRFNRPAV